jgi:hypothetical protein
MWHIFIIRFSKVLLDPAYLLLQRPRTPPLDAAHLGVEFSLERVVEVDDLPDVGP